MADEKQPTYVKLRPGHPASVETMRMLEEIFRANPKASMAELNKLIREKAGWELSRTTVGRFKRKFQEPDQPTPPRAAPKAAPAKSWHDRYNPNVPARVHMLRKIGDIKQQLNDLRAAFPQIHEINFHFLKDQWLDSRIVLADVVKVD